jgi:putative hemolysin
LFHGRYETQGILKVINTKGTPTLAPLIGTVYSTSRTITSIQAGDAAKNTGRILYVDNIKPITRSADQIKKISKF